MSRNSTTQRDAAISGTIQGRRPKYVTSSGGIVSAVQLYIDQPQLTYEGFSGAPVEMKDAHASPSAMIIEEVPSEENVLHSHTGFALEMFEIHVRSKQFETMEFGGQTFSLPDIYGTDPRKLNIDRLREQAEFGLAPSNAVSNIEASFGAAFSIAGEEGQRDLQNLFGAPDLGREGDDHA